ncbi:Amidase 1, partial [Sarracenia purpurea var. burkii]
MSTSLKLDKDENAQSVAGHIVKYVCLGDHVKDNVPTLKPFFGKGHEDQEYHIASL